MADVKVHTKTPEGQKQAEDAAKKDKHLPENSQSNLTDKLDEALEDTFPSSDPVSVKITK